MVVWLVPYHVRRDGPPRACAHSSETTVFGKQYEKDAPAIFFLVPTSFTVRSRSVRALYNGKRRKEREMAVAMERAFLYS